MSDTILEYLEKFGSKTFNRLPFGEVDALILSQFSYLKFDGIVPGEGDVDSFVTLPDIKNHPRFNDLFSDKRYEKPNRKLFELMSESVRFGGLKMDLYVNIIGEEREIQFSAVTFSFPEGLHYVAYRGTDENMVGWKEDANLSIMEEIPGEKEAVKYLKDVSKVIKGDFYVGGHSKGGLNAIYASSAAPVSVKKRIIGIYSFDGPAIREDVRSKVDYAGVRDRYHKFVPKSSLIGMIFETDDICTVVKNKAAGILQHDPYNWIVRDIDFWYEDSLSKSAEVVNSAMANWLKGLDKDARTRFIDCVFEVADACKDNDLVSIYLNPVKSIRQMLDGYDRMDEGERQFLKEVLSGLIRNTGGFAKDEVQSGWGEFTDSVDKWIVMVQGVIEEKRSSKNKTETKKGTEKKIQKKSPKMISDKKKTKG